MRFHSSGNVHFLTISCFQRQPYFDKAEARNCFERNLERARGWYMFEVYGYVVMPEHVHLLLGEPQNTKLSIAIQMLKQNVARELRRPGIRHFWTKRYFDFNVLRSAAMMGKLEYIHLNPVKRGLATEPAQWKWSSFQTYSSGGSGTVRIQTHWSDLWREVASQQK